MKIENKTTTLLLNIVEAAVLLGITVWQLRRVLARKEMPVVRIGRKLYVTRKSLIRWTETSEEKYKPQERQAA